MACLNQTECGEGSPDERIGLSYLNFALRGAMREPTRSAADHIGSPWVGMFYLSNDGWLHASVEAIRGVCEHAHLFNLRKAGMT
jgi:hypothetical protein